ncbi:MAG: hypothetical protein ACRD3A_05280 [Terriglobales bacterium]
MSAAGSNPGMDFAAPPVVELIQRRSLIIGAVAGAACAAGAFMNPTQFFRSYLTGYLLWLGISLGCLAILMLQHLSGGIWGFVIRRLLEAATRVFPVLTLLFVPLLFGMHQLYPWTDPAKVAQDELLQHKAVYLNATGFVARAAFYFLLWCGAAYLLSRWSLEHDRDPSARLRARLQALSAGGLLLYGLTVTFSAIDWVMSLDPHWYSTIYGMLFMAGGAVAGMALVIAMASLLARHKPMSEVFAPEHFHDLGKLLLAFVMVWAYFSFSQVLIIWSGNLPEEITWYRVRLEGGWRAVGGVLLVFQFLLPFLLLLSRDLKRHGRTLAAVAAAVLVMRYVDLYWLVAPSFPGAESGLNLHWLDLAAPVAVGGIWLAEFFRQLKGRPLVPLNDPLLPQVLEHAHGSE